MRSLGFVHVTLVLVLGAPLALADHPVNHDPLGFDDPDGPLLAETCAQTVFEGNDLLPEVPLQPGCDTLALLTGVAVDGYVLAIERLDASHFRVRVRHALASPTDGGNLPVASAPEPLAARDCVSFEACGGDGLYVHGATLAPGDDGNPLTGAYPAQRITTDPDGLSWTIEVPGAPSSQVYVTVVGSVHLASGEVVRGFYNPLKLATPLDALDAVPYPTLL